MEFKRNDCTFTIPDRPTVRQQLAWFSAAGGRDPNDVYDRYWEGAKQLIQEWQCEAISDFKISLDEISNPTQTNIILWAGIEVWRFMNKLEDIPKNS